jgi:hypothetical protein
MSSYSVRRQKKKATLKGEILNEGDFTVFDCASAQPHNKRFMPTLTLPRASATAIRAMHDRSEIDVLDDKKKRRHHLMPPLRFSVVQSLIPPSHRPR